MKDVTKLLSPSGVISQEFSALLESALDGIRRYYVITVAWENGLFDYTVTPKTPQDLARELGYREIMAQMFCDALVELGLLTKTHGSYVNSLMASSYLSSSSPSYMINTIQNMEDKASHWMQLADILKNGPITQERQKIFGDRWLISIAEWAATGSVANAVNTVKSYLNVNSWRRLLDVGGGHGLYSVAFTALNPKLEAYVFDLPRIVPVTRKYVEEYDAERVHVLSGDFYKDDVGRDYDAVFSSFNQSCSDPALIPKLMQALKPGGDLILRRFKDSFREGALKTLDWNLLSFEGKKLGSKAHSSGPVVGTAKYIKQLKAAGFTSINIVSVDTMSEIVFARKPSGNGSEK